MNLIKYHYQSRLLAHAARPRLKKNLQYGLYGGSFNPIHDGHLAVADHAFRACQLDKLIWLVTPQNPFKDPSIYRPYGERLKKAQQCVSHPDYIISDIEAQIKTRNTYETLRFLNKAFPHVKFTYIIGSDSFSHMHTWHFFKEITRMCAFAIIVRPTHRFNIRGFKAMHYFRKNKIPYRLILKRFYHISSTALRAKN